MENVPGGVLIVKLADGIAEGFVWARQILGFRMFSTSLEDSLHRDVQTKYIEMCRDVIAEIHHHVWLVLMCFKEFLEVRKRLLYSALQSTV